MILPYLRVVLFAFEGLVILYLLVSLILFVFFTNNVFFWKKGRYSIHMGDNDSFLVTCETKFLDKPRIAYHLCVNPRGAGKWAVFLHSWGRNGKRMKPMADVYWRHGYSVLFVDARSFGMSQYMPVSTAFYFARDTIRILKRENITNPVVHGLSFGAIAGTILSHEYTVRAAVLEALTSDLTRIYEDFLQAMSVPYFLFFWLPKLLYKYPLPWREYSPKNLLPTLNIPVFLIHGENDVLFKPELHFEANKQALASNPRARFWLVPGSIHSKMHLNSSYEDKLEAFLHDLDSS